ncbi:MAG TPA: hypothetical protein PLD46_07460 [Hyphomicrobium sp.]|nr:hypothetical protein [Hyphomicrobium sp.]
MFSALIHRAQSTVDNAIGQVVNRAIIAIPFLVAGAFATAALAFRLVREFGPETANLMLAGMFLVLGIMSAFIFRVRPLSEGAAHDAVPEALADPQTVKSADSSIDGADRELLMAALTSAAPIALPALIRAILRNLPLVVAVLSALFVLTRPSDEPAASEVAVP